MAVTYFGLMSGTASGSDPLRILIVLSCTRARALIAGTTVDDPGTSESISAPRMYGTSASVCLTSNIKCGVWQGALVSVSSAGGPPVANVLLLKSVVTRGAPPPIWKL